MALKATIFKAEIEVSDLDRGHFAMHALTIARHPSETDQRMMVRVLAFALNAHERLEFGRGLSTEGEADLLQQDLTGALELWIDVGLPDEREIRKACGRSKEVVVYTYGGRSAALWWAQNQEALSKQRNLRVYDIPAEVTERLARWAQRNMKFSVTIQEGEIYFANGDETLHLNVNCLNADGRG